MKKQKTAHISEEKKKVVAEISNLIKSKNTILIASIKDIPASHFQEIVKKLRNKAIVKVPKKNLVLRAIDSSNSEAIQKLKENIQSNVAVLFSDLDSFELALELVKAKNPSRAKVGQEAPMDIEIPAGPTELVPGPAISELGALGIQIQIEKGRITIKEPKIIVKKGEKISANAAEIMAKLDIKPFSVGFIPLVAFDTKENKLYTGINIDKEKTLEELKNSFKKAMAFAIEICYISSDTIKLLIRKAASHEKKLNKIISGEQEEISEQAPATELVKEKAEPEDKKEKETSAGGLASLFG